MKQISEKMKRIREEKMKQIREDKVKQIREDKMKQRNRISGFVRFLILTLIFLSAVMLPAACGKGKNGKIPEDEGYLAGTDSQYFSRNTIQETDKGVFTVHKQFVYFMDNETGEIYPVCSRTNCLHDKETDPEKRKECFAYLEQSSELFDELTTLMLYQDSLYAGFALDGVIDKNSPVMEKFPGLVFPYVFYRIKTDGSARDLFHAEGGVKKCIQHRGYLYYWTDSHQVLDENGKISLSTSLGLYRLDLNAAFPKAELIYEPEAQGRPGLAAGELNAFGNYVFFSDNFSVNNEPKSDSFAFNIHDRSLTDLNAAEYQLPDNLYYEGGWYSRMAIPEGDGYVYTIARTDWKHSEAEPVITGLSRFEWPVSDGKYLYVHNYVEKIFSDDPSFPVTFKVYDKDMKPVDEFRLPEKKDSWKWNPNAPDIGGEKYLYFTWQDDESQEWGIGRMDKSLIGNLKGAEIETELITYCR